VPGKSPDLEKEMDILKHKIQITPNENPNKPTGRYFIIRLSKSKTSRIVEQEKKFVTYKYLLSTISDFLSRNL
jgi:hypothetical protein